MRTGRTILPVLLMCLPQELEYLLRYLVCLCSSRPVPFGDRTDYIFTSGYPEGRALQALDGALRTSSPCRKGLGGAS